MKKLMSSPKKLLSIFLCALGIMMLAACSTTGDGNMPNPFIDCKTLSAAAKVSGFEMTAPDTANGCAQSKIQAVTDQMVQVIYSEGDNSVYIRKGTKAAAKDAYSLTGDYNKYSYSSEVTVGDSTVIVKGDAPNEILAAAWSDGKYYYAITAEGAALTQNTVEALVKAVK